MAEDGGKSNGWKILERFKSLPYVITFQGDVKRTPLICKTSLQTEMTEEDTDITEMSPLYEQHRDLFMTNLNDREDHSDGASLCCLRQEEPESATDDGVLSSQDLLHQLYVLAVGIRDFEILRTKVKDKRDRAKKSISNNGTKLKTVNESSSTRKAFLKTKEAILIEEIKEREKYPFSDSYLERAYKLSIPTKISKKLHDEIFKKKTLKAKTFGKEQLTPIDIPKPTKNEMRSEELGSSLEEELTTKKRARILAKKSVNQRILALEKRMLPEAAVAEVVTAMEEQEAAKTGMMKVLDEIRGTRNKYFDDLPLDITERWIAAHTEQLRNTFGLHGTVVRHALSSLISPVGLNIL